MESKDELDTLALVVLLVLCASWGLQQVTIKVAVAAVPPAMQAGMRSIGGVLLLTIWMRIRHVPVFVRDGTLGWGLAAGILFALEFLFIYWGMEFTNASRAVVFLYLSPFVVALGAHRFIPGERLRGGQVAGLLCAFAGVVCAFGESIAFADRRMLIGDAMLAAAAFFWGATTVMIKAGPLARISPARTLLYQLVVSAVALPVGSLLLGEPAIGRLTPLLIACLVYQIAWIAFVSYLAWFWLICRYPTNRLAAFTFLTPLCGVAFGGLLLGEPISATLLLALALVATGIYLVNRRTTGRGPESGAESRVDGGRA